MLSKNSWGKEKRGKEAGGLEWWLHSQGLSAGVAMVGGWHPRHPQAVVSAVGALVARQRPTCHVRRRCQRHIVRGKVGALSSFVGAAS